MITRIVMVATLAAFVLLLARKWGGIEWMQVHGSRLVSEMAGCSLCLSWWACVLVALCFAVAFSDVRWMVLPFFATPVTRMMI